FRSFPTPCLLTEHRPGIRVRATAVHRFVDCEVLGNAPSRSPSPLPILCTRCLAAWDEEFHRQPPPTRIRNRKFENFALSRMIAYLLWFATSAADVAGTRRRLKPLLAPRCADVEPRTFDAAAR